MLKNKEINNWKSWEPKKLKSQKCPLLQIKNSPTLSKNVKSKIQLDENSDTINKAKIELIHILQTNEKEKNNHEIELLKVKLEKEKLQIELLKMSIEKEKAMKKLIEENSANITLLR